MSRLETTQLQRVPDLIIERISDHDLQLSDQHQRVICSHDALAALDLFYAPRTLGDATSMLQALADAGAFTQDPQALIDELYHAGLVRERATMQPILRSDDSGYDSAPIHVAMLNDRPRVESFLAGIRATVRPGDVVLDLGTGIGVFAIAAAQAGAKHVYAVESNGIGDLAEAAFAANGLSDRITLIRGWSNRITLPERADVLISEMVGNEPMGDFIMEVMLDARKRLLKPDARIVPARVKIFGLPLSIPESELEQLYIAPGILQQWHTWLGADITATDVVRNDLHGGNYIDIRPYVARDWPVLTDPVLLAEIDPLAITQLMIDIEISIHAHRDGVINGLLVYFETEAGPGAQLSLHPAESRMDTFRYLLVWLLRRPLDVSEGDPLTLSYRYRVRGMHTGIDIRHNAPVLESI